MSSVFGQALAVEAQVEVLSDSEDDDDDNTDIREGELDHDSLLDETLHIEASSPGAGPSRRRDDQPGVKADHVQAGSRSNNKVAKRGKQKKKAEKKKDRRRKDPLIAAVLEKIPGSCQEHMTMFVKATCKCKNAKSNQIAAISLWPQYSIEKEKNGQRYPMQDDSLWIKLSNREQWLLDLVKLRVQTGSKTRDIAQRVKNVILEVFTQALRKRRESDSHKPKKHMNDDSEQEDSQGSQNQGWKARKHRRVETKLCSRLDIEGHSVYCINKAKEMFLRIDPATVKFLTEYVHGKINAAVDQEPLDTLPRDESTANKDVREEKAFSFNSSEEKEVRDCVSWSPTDSCWNVTIRKNWTDARRMQFHVDRKLKGDEFKKARQDVYGNAVRYFNDKDKSTRSRIELPA